MFKKNALLLAGIVFLLQSTAIPPLVGAQSKTVLTLSESHLRKLAVKAIVPTFPEEALRSGKSGVVVVQLEYDDAGKTTQVEVLECPSQTIGQAVTKALMQWEFKPQTLRGKPISIRGKLTFYYVIDKQGRGRVQNPQQFNEGA